MPATTLAPIGPVLGMMAAVDLLTYHSVDEVDLGAIKARGIAPGNEYKALQALRFLGLINEAGQPTLESRVLRARGEARARGLAAIVRRAYADLFGAVDLERASRDEVHEYFVTRYNLSRDLAGKASSFFLELCRQANLAAPRPSRDFSRPRGSSGRRSRHIAAPAGSPPPAQPDSLAVTEPAERQAPDGVGVSADEFTDAQRNADRGLADRSASDPAMVEAAPPALTAPIADRTVTGTAPTNDATAPLGATPTLLLTVADLETRTDVELIRLLRRFHRAWQTATAPESEP